MATIKRILGLGIIGAIVGAIIAIAICLWDAAPYENAWGETIFGPTNTKLLDILPEWMLIGAIAVNLIVWTTSNKRY